MNKTRKQQEQIGTRSNAEPAWNNLENKRKENARGKKQQTNKVLQGRKQRTIVNRDWNNK
jgi:hypothetical protein